MNTYQRERKLKICGVVGICPTTRLEFLEEVFSLTEKDLTSTVDLIGVPAVISAKEDSRIADVYNTSTFAAIDGMPLVKIARRKGFNCDRCAAPDIMGPVFKRSVQDGKTHYFYGGKNQQVLNNLKKNLEHDYQGIKIVGMYSPPFRPLTDDEDEKVCAEINSLNPDFIWVGIGAPKQELWMFEHQNKINRGVMLGVGAGFDFFAGTLDKAPKWMEKACLEWLYRLFKEPKRLWKRYIIGGIKFLYYSVFSKIYS